MVVLFIYFASEKINKEKLLKFDLLRNVIKMCICRRLITELITYPSFVYAQKCTEV